MGESNIYVVHVLQPFHPQDKVLKLLEELICMVAAPHEPSRSPMSTLACMSTATACMFAAGDSNEAKVITFTEVLN